MRAVGAAPDPQVVLDGFGAALVGGLVGVVPLVLVALVVGVGGTLAQTGGLVSLNLLVPKLDRISPKAGFKRLFSTKSLWETAKQAAKLTIIAVVAWPRVADVAHHLIDRGRVPLAPALAVIASDLLSLVRTIVAMALVVAVADYAWQRRQHRSGLKMTKEAVKQEMRQKATPW